MTDDEIIAEGEKIVRQLGLNPDKLADWEKAVQIVNSSSR